MQTLQLSGKGINTILSQSPDVAAWDTDYNQETGRFTAAVFLTNGIKVEQSLTRSEIIAIRDKYAQAPAAGSVWEICFDTLAKIMTLKILVHNILSNKLI